ncbi:BLUF domain-containing protein [Undibacterium crateris]|uniref:BLUF domain-containing protein n=1 Tax=Undibacterium crateris TaxID=2528175 RepID=UPI001389CF9B|nr:BLUF domain-containing protein [Undibacterium crateris]NDI86403.1 F420H(2):quinone oxidoreductase [Undibacterium crateris]
MPTKLYALAYISTATERLSTPEAIDALLVDARAFNRKCDVTGVLLHNDGSFFQYLEGSKDAVDLVYERIRRSFSHRNICELVSEPILLRHFSSWSMGFAEGTASELKAIAQAHWNHERRNLKGASHVSPGLKLLLHFWQNSKRCVA